MKLGDLLLELVANPFLTVALAILTVPLLPVGYWWNRRRVGLSVGCFT